jgi:uncharacterized protein
MKGFFNVGRFPKLFFWRDHRGREIDLIEERADGIDATEIKSGSTLNKNYFENLRWFAKTVSSDALSMNLRYGGERDTQRGEIMVKSWKSA